MLALLLALPLLVFRGNVALVDDVYPTALNLPAATKATPASARAVAVRLQKFLHDSGYVLATVRARAKGEQIVVDVDEGRLDKIIFLGGGAFETLRLRLDLNLRDGVFNQPELERQLKGLAARLGLGDFAYEVVPVAHVKPPRLQLDVEPVGQPSTGPFGAAPAYELRILVQPGVLRPGISPELEVDSLEGGGVGATYHSGRLLYEQDRYQLGGRVAGAVRRDRVLFHLHALAGRRGVRRARHRPGGAAIDPRPRGPERPPTGRLAPRGFSICDPGGRPAAPGPAASADARIAGIRRATEAAQFGGTADWSVAGAGAAILARAHPAVRRRDAFVDLRSGVDPARPPPPVRPRRAGDLAYRIRRVSGGGVDRRRRLPARALRERIHPAARGAGTGISPVALSRRVQGGSVPQCSRVLRARPRQRRREDGGGELGRPGRASSAHRRVPARRLLRGGMGLGRQVRLGRRPRHPAGFLEGHRAGAAITFSVPMVC